MPNTLPVPFKDRIFYRQPIEAKTIQEIPVIHIECRLCLSEYDEIARHRGGGMGIEWTVWLQCPKCLHKVSQRWHPVKDRENFWYMSYMTSGEFPK
jgi:hypothetical protein